MDPFKVTVQNEIFGNLSNFEDGESLNSEQELDLDLMHVSESESVPDHDPDLNSREAVSDNFSEQQFCEGTIVRFRETCELSWS
jgi:hypothetical protein